MTEALLLKRPLKRPARVMRSRLDAPSRQSVQRAQSGAQPMTRPQPVIERWQQGFQEAARVSRKIFAALAQRDLLITALFVGVLLLCGVGAVYASHLNRQLFNELNHLQDQGDGYQREWSQLLLEQSAIGAHSRVEYIASSKLGMMVPGREDMVIVESTRRAP